MKYYITFIYFAFAHMRGDTCMPRHVCGGRKLTCGKKLVLSFYPKDPRDRIQVTNIFICCPGYFIFLFFVRLIQARVID